MDKFSEEFFKEKGSQGGKKTRDTYGSEHFKAIRKKSRGRKKA